MTIKSEAIGWYFKKLKKYPDIDNPKTWNEKIQWLKLYDQDRLQIQLCDKKLVKDYVSQLIGKEYVIPSTENYPAVWKTNHGSGHVKFVNSKEDEIYAEKKLTQKLKTPFATWNGEWAYRFIDPCIIKEKRLEDNTDYKFHCVNGQVKFMQLLWDRGKRTTKECIFDANGNPTDLHLYPAIEHVKRNLPCSKENFVLLKKLSEKLSQNWKYVRVDLYYSNDQPWFGELTFWPGAGVYPENKDSLTFGNLLDFDLTTKKPPVIE